jgi:phosphodiesterase/alkaline phosphatase D-like protein
MSYINDPTLISEELNTLELEVSTVDANDGESFDSLYVNVVFTDGTRLYEPHNRLVEERVQPIPILPPRGESKRFTLPVPAGIERSLADIAELYVRKSGDDGWFVGSVLLFANGEGVPLLGSRNVNQFLDDDDDVLLLRDWSTRSACVAQATSAVHPLAPSGNRILGPVLGQMSESSALVLYRVDREGSYRFRAVDALTNTQVADLTADLLPCGRFQLNGLQPNRRYNFDLNFVRAGVESPVPGAAGSLVTYPAVGKSRRSAFCFAFGSCVNPDKQAAQGVWTAIRSLAQTPPPGIEPVRLFTHLGDTFYFYDHMTEEKVRNLASMHAAHVSMRRHVEFLDMARVVPCCGVWDDHDFAGDNKDSSDISPELRLQARNTWLQYWGNNQPISRTHDLGLTTRISHDLLDIYLLDGRFNRDRGNGIFFGQELITELLRSIDQRGATRPRAVVLASGSNWNHMSGGSKENYGHGAYKAERESLYKALAARMGTTINGLILLSGDDHVNEIYYVDLGGCRMAPEFGSAPMTSNTDLADDGNDLERERVASFPTGGDEGKRGFATLTVDTSRSLPNGQWTATVRYYQEAAAMKYESRTYLLANGQFNPA